MCNTVSLSSFEGILSGPVPLWGLVGYILHPPQLLAIRYWLIADVRGKRSIIFSKNRIVKNVSFGKISI